MNRGECNTDDFDTDNLSKYEYLPAYSLINTFSVSYRWTVHRLFVRISYLLIHIVNVLNSADPLIISMMTGFVIRKGLSYASARYTPSRNTFQMSGYRERAVDPAIRVYGIFVCQQDINYDLLLILNNSCLCDNRIITRKGYLHRKKCINNIKSN